MQQHGKGRLLGAFLAMAMAMAMVTATTGCGDRGDSGDNGNTDGGTPTNECSDGIDNDGDGLVDWQQDLGCTGPDDPTEGGKNNELDNGWTVFEPAQDASIIYVSSGDGDDAWSGLAPDWDGGLHGPKKTVAAGIGLLQDGKPDWLLFKRGDVWVDETMGNWSISGRSATEPVIIASYGVGDGDDATQRPLFEVSSTWLICHGGGGASADRAHVRILGLHIKMVTKDPDDPRFTGSGGSCIQWLQDGGDVLIEDIKCEWAQLNLQSEPTLPFTVRRSVFSKSYALDSHAQNLFTSIGASLLIEENLFNHGGWSDDFRLVLTAPVTDATAWTAITDGRFGLDLAGDHFDVAGVDLSGAGTMQEVASLLEAAINAVVGAGADEVQLLFTGGGVFQLRAPGFPSGADYAITAYGGSAAGTDLDALFNTAAQGVPESTIFNRNMYLAYGEGNTTVRGNIDANGASGGVQQRMGGVNEDIDAAGVSLHHNTYWSTAPDPPDVWSRGWFSLGASVSMEEWLTATGETDATVEQVQFVDPDRTLETYMVSLGEAPTYQAFIDQALQQSKYHWREAYTAQAVNAYIRAGFALAAGQ